MKRIGASALAMAAMLVSGRAMAELVGKPLPDQIGFQPSATGLAHDLHAMDNLLLYIITAIVIFVTALLAIVILRYRAGANPEPARFTHNALIEVIWTAVPVMILVAIAFPSLNLLYKQVVVPPADLTVKAIGNQWYWSYEYPDQEVSFDSLMVAPDYASWDAVMASEEGRAEVEAYGVDRTTWLLSTDADVVVPVGKVVKLIVTANDVIHSWTVPSFGVKIDAVPGRLNEMWFKVDEPGVYYGQCSELCGDKHAYMPIEVHAVPQEAFDAWIAEQQSAALPAATKLALAN